MMTQSYRPKNSEKSTSSESESDEDYVPSSKDLKDDDDDIDDSISEHNSDNCDEEGSNDDANGGNLGKRRKKLIRSRKRRHIAIETVEVKREDKPEPTFNIDDVWNEFKQDCGLKKVEKETPAVQNVTSSETVEISRNNIKTEKKTVTKLFEFSSETVEVHKTVPVTETQSSMGEKPTPLPRASSKGLASALGELNKKNKLSILEKSKLDWNCFKEKEGITEELQTHNKGKDGYLAKQDFLQRSDLRQFEIEKAMRNSRRRLN